MGGSGKEGRKRGKKRREKGTLKEIAKVKEGKTVLPVGRYFCACFVFNFSPPFAPRRGRRAATPSRGAVAGWCAVVLVRMHISVPHILIQGVITRLSSAHSHHRLNHPPPSSSSSFSSSSSTYSGNLHLRFYLLLHL